ncbi:energy-coupling factor transporter transmembrane component T [Mycobacterium avium]|uniref:energy-coupling factor transporter transmembrane component T n=1 Tax=Mycobacterium avium TaxID=1764 RepID=UPI000213B061|nr:energy-coupling factor transporter transmembrane component T [Mycobacterium avium]ELP48221.1 hypothetical protein D522_00796 [Mycobacterium avium subsp. paratuberculosis S5]ASE13584.1 energy-coupling factor transporter transmembrane protein EcfT [Mycobacterium avium subsp. paratuberculosis]ASF97746.1 energy-coupling factor transporter transmembrane protein EcfT [Mycobacterium avium subsp. paratuberculosis]AYQ68158.1 energy-coupling factor transporter transmembrane protein EcfT [Mycobacterium
MTQLDPRTKTVLVLASSIAVMAPGGEVFVPAAVIVGMLLAVAEQAWVRAAILPSAAGATAAVAYLLPQAIPHPIIGAIGTVAAYLLRLIAVGAIVIHLVNTTTPSEFTAALRATHIPRAITVSGSVMLRFLPTIVGEARAVSDAMRLRGIGGTYGMLRHPVCTIEYFTVPLIASSLRVAEDLSATALLRGLGSAARPTTMYPPRFGKADALIGCIVSALTVTTVLWPVKP